jgi:DNA invertase Pin-like site-specific DNA recombinase
MGAKHAQLFDARTQAIMQSIDTTTPAGRLMFQVTGAFAEFERSMIRQRINAGLKRAVEQR